MTTDSKAVCSGKKNRKKAGEAAKKLAFYVDGIGGAATPTGEVLRKLADDLTGKKTLENREGWARGLYSRADLLEEAAAEIRKLIPPAPAQSPSTSDAEG